MNIESPAGHRIGRLAAAAATGALPVAAAAILLLSACASPEYLRAAQESLNRCNPLEGQPDCQDGHRVNTAEDFSAPGADYAGIEDLDGRYEQAIGAGDAGGFAALFTEDAVIDTPAGLVQGRDRIRRELETPGTGAVASFARVPHVVTNVVIDLDGRKAHGTATWIELDKGGPGGEPRIRNFGRYEDQYVRRHGQWFIARRRIVV